METAVCAMRAFFRPSARPARRDSLRVLARPLAVPELLLCRHCPVLHAAGGAPARMPLCLR